MLGILVILGIQLVLLVYLYDLGGAPAGWGALWVIIGFWILQLIKYYV